MPLRPEAECKTPLAKRESVQRWRERWPERSRHHDRTQRLRRIGWTPELYDEVNEQQGGLCACCGGPPNGRWPSLHADHNHETGERRALVCFTCNVNIEMFENGGKRAMYENYLNGWLDTKAKASA